MMAADLVDRCLLPPALHTSLGRRGPSRTLRRVVQLLLWGALVSASLLHAEDDTLRTLSEQALSDEALLERAIRVYRLENNCLEATRLYFELLGREPRPHLQVAALFNMGICYERRQLWEEALDNYQLILRDFPSVPEAADARFRLGVVLEQQGRFREALAAFSAISRSHPGVSDIDVRAIAVQRAWQCVMLGQTREALRLLQPVLNIWEAMPEEERRPERFFFGKAHLALGLLLLEYAEERPVGPAGPLEHLGLVFTRIGGPAREDAWLRVRLSEREERIRAARVHLELAILTQEPIWVSAGHYLEGRAAQAYVQDVLRSPVPSYLQGEARPEYLEALKTHLRRTLVTASDLYLRGHELATGNADPSEWARLLKLKTEQLEREGVDGLWKPDPSQPWKGNLGGNRAELTL